MISIDVDTRAINVAADLQVPCKKTGYHLPPNTRAALMQKYAALVGSASKGALTSFSIFNREKQIMTQDTKLKNFLR